MDDYEVAPRLWTSGHRGPHGAASQRPLWAHYTGSEKRDRLTEGMRETTHFTSAGH